MLHEKGQLTGSGEVYLSILQVLMCALLAGRTGAPRKSNKLQLTPSFYFRASSSEYLLTAPLTASEL
jgi:hypothetical protein